MTADNFQRSPPRPSPPPPLLLKQVLSEYWRVAYLFCAWLETMYDVICLYLRYMSYLVAMYLGYLRSLLCNHCSPHRRADPGNMPRPCLQLPHAGPLLASRGALACCCVPPAWSSYSVQHHHHSIDNNTSTLDPVFTPWHQAAPTRFRDEMQCGLPHKAPPAPASASDYMVQRLPYYIVHSSMCGPHSIRGLGQACF